MPFPKNQGADDPSPGGRVARDLRFSWNPGREVTLARVARDVLGHRTPPKLGWNWWAFFLGPIWFVAEGIWFHAIILILLIALSGGVLLPFAMVYSAVKSREILEDRRIARHTFY